MRGAICSPFVSLKTIVCLQLVFLKTSLETFSILVFGIVCQSPVPPLTYGISCSIAAVIGKQLGTELRTRWIDLFEGAGLFISAQGAGVEGDAAEFEGGRAFGGERVEQGLETFK